MYRYTLETNKGTFTIDVEHCMFKVGERVFAQSPYYKRRGTYKIIKIEVIYIVHILAGIFLIFTGILIGIFSMLVFFNY